MTVLIIINTGILALIALLHLYWVFGGKRFFEEALPTDKNDEFIFYPKTFITLIVIFGLTIFTLITIGNLGIFDRIFDRIFIIYGTYAVAFIFLIRAIGDFNYIGFSKKIKGTVFANKDTKIYSPFCLGISLISLAIILFN